MKVTHPDKKMATIRDSHKKARQSDDGDTMMNPDNDVDYRHATVILGIF
jgi:hypothetical protein